MNKFFYQPLSLDSVNSNNIVARKSSDRLESMISFCNNYFGESIKDKTFLDIGSSYGYFVDSFIGICKESYGVENAQKELSMCSIFYPNAYKNIFNQDFITFLDSSSQYDIVSCLSVTHTIIMDSGEEYAIDFLHKIDLITKEVLFFEMGQEHEGWYKEKMQGWNEDKIEEWILQNTSFNFCQRLSKDEDSIGTFEGNFGRTLFAFYRNPIE